MSAEKALRELGFTATESAVYSTLRRIGPRTGYAAAKAMGRPAAQVYAALDSLLRKGAVLATADEPRTWEAVGQRVLMEQLEAEFRKRRVSAERALAALEPEGPGDDVYRLSTRSQVLPRVREMLGAVRESVMLDCFPGVLKEIRAWAEEAAARGVSVAVISYDSTSSVAGAVMVRSPTASVVASSIAGEILQCAVDGEQYLVAYFRPDGEVSTAFWTANPLIAGVAQNGLAAELGYTRLLMQIEAQADAAELSAIPSQLVPFLWRTSPGYRTFVAAREAAARDRVYGDDN